MRPDDRSGRWQPIEGPADIADGFGFDGFGPLDADLESLDAELGEAGVQARRMLHGQSHPTRYFANQLRARLAAAYPLTGAGANAASGAEADAAPLLEPRGLSPERPARNGNRPRLTAPGETWAPVALAPRIARRTPTVLPRARWGLVAAAALTGALAAGALGARLDWLLPSPSVTPSQPVAVIDPTDRPLPGATDPPILTVPSSAPTTGPTLGPDATPRATDAAATAKPRPSATSKPAPATTPKPTPKPEPTKPPVGSMDFMAKACPGGVLLDWTKPSTAVAHYHTLRKLGGDVPAAYPAAGTTEIETATSFDAAVTDGFDVTITGGESATYRAFAFDADDNLMAYSTSRSVTTLGRIPLGDLTVGNVGPGSINVGWAAADLHAACFTYGKLVVSEEDPDPSYLKGSTYWAAISDPAATGTSLEGLPSGKTVWMRYEIIRTTSLGKFVVARTDAVQVTIP